MYQVIPIESPFGIIVAMKILKFQKDLVPLVLNGSKTSTWRAFDDKDLSVGDNLELRTFETGESFAFVKITSVIEKTFGELTDDDKVGHETFKSDEEMYETYSRYYSTPIGPTSKVKIAHFELI
jgi:hypothetical protein